MPIERKWMYAAGGSVVILGVAGFLLYRRSKKQQQAEQKQLQADATAEDHFATNFAATQGKAPTSGSQLGQMTTQQRAQTMASTFYRPPTAGTALSTKVPFTTSGKAAPSKIPMGTLAAKAPSGSLASGVTKTFTPSSSSSSASSASSSGSSSPPPAAPKAPSTTADAFKAGGIPKALW